MSSRRPVYLTLAALLIVACTSCNEDTSVSPPPANNLPATDKPRISILGSV